MQFCSIFQNFLSSPTTATGGRVGGDFLVRRPGFFYENVHI